MTIGIDPVTTNPLEARIARYRAAFAKGENIQGKPITAEDMAKAEAQLANTFSDHAALQNVQASAFAMGKINEAVAQTIYMALGEAPGADGWAAGTDLATKIVVMQALDELLAMALRNVGWSR